MRLSDLQDIDIADISTWPVWFRMAMAAVGCVAILGAGYWFIIKGEIERLERLEGEEVSLRKTFLEKKALAVNLPAYRKQLVEMEDRFGVMVQQLPSSSEVPVLLIDITQAGLSRGLKFELFKPRGENRSDFYATLPIDIRATGQYHVLAEFVSDLAALPRIVTVGNVSLQPRDDGELVMSAVVNTYRYLDEEEISAAQAKKGEPVRTVRQ